jgi:hypothetical protein
VRLPVAVLLALAVATVAGAQPASERFIGTVQWIAGERMALALDNGSSVPIDLPYEAYLDLKPDDDVGMAGAPLAVIDCFGILDDARIRRYFELGCEVKGLGRGHIQRLKTEIREGR